MLCHSQGIVAVEVTESQLTQCTKTALKNEWYRGMTVIDCRGTGIKIKDAHKLRGVGLFWGYNVFLNQRIRVELKPLGDPFIVSVGEARDMVLRSFRTWHGWQSRGDVEDLQDKVEKAETIPDLINLLKE